MYRTSSIFFYILISLISFVIAQNKSTSPCPRLFIYEDDSKQSGKWFGVLTMVSETDANGVWVKLVFDSPPLELGNWYGDVTPISSKVYVIINLEDKLQAHVPKTIRLFIKHDPSKPPPQLVSFRVNEKQLCPEVRIIGTTTVSLVLKTGSYRAASAVKPSPSPSVPILPPIETVPGPESVTSEDEDFFESDLHQFLKPEGGANPSNGNEISCGTVVVRARPLVTYGEPTFEGEFPWHAAIYRIKGVDLVYICGASLISNNFVITAAHCVTKPRRTTPQSPDSIIVYLGKHYLKEFLNEGIQDRQISEIIVHPQYNGQNYSHDIALLKLEHPAEYSDYVRPVCLWQESTDLNGIVKKQGSVVGWGFDETGKLTDQLMKATMPVVSQETCIYSFREFYSRYTSPTTYCAGFRNGTSVCNGDSGGGMVFPKSYSSPRNTVWQLRGLVSISASLQDRNRCDPSNYVVFTDVAKHLNWIMNIIK